MRKLVISLIIFSIVISLAVCNKVLRYSKDKTDKSEKPSIVSTKTIKDSKEKNNINKYSPIKEKTKEIEVYVEGQTELRQATLTRSNESGYEFYLLENFAFTSEEPGKDVIYSKYDDSFFVRVEKLDKATDLDKFKTQQITAYKSIGKVTEISPSTLFLKGFQDANFYFITESKDAKGLNTSIKYIVKTFDGEKFAFTFFMPLKEAAEGITPSLWAMVNTLEVIK